MPKILHTADWQIGRLYTSFDTEVAVPLAEARYAAVERLAALATQEQVDAVVVAGDIFDAQTVSARCIRRLFNALAGYSGPWVLIPGNHDAALAESVWTHALRLQAIPPNVHLALQARVVELPQARLAFLCAPLTQRHTFGDLTEWFDTTATAEGWLRIGVAHGAVQGVLPEGIDSANPIAQRRAARARLDYLALGDWHGTHCIDERTWYSGTPEPDRFKSNHAGQALLVHIEAPGALPQVQTLRTGQHRWLQMDSTVRVPSDIDTVLQQLAALDPNDVLDLRLSGSVDLPGQRRLLAAIDRAEARVRALRRDVSTLQLVPTAEDIAGLQADGYLGELLAELRDDSNRHNRHNRHNSNNSNNSNNSYIDDARRAQDALQLLTGLLAERQARRTDLLAGTGSASGAKP